MRMSINSLLYFASTGMFGMAVWLVANVTLTPPSSADQQAPSRQGYENAERVIQVGKGPDRAVTPINPGWWEQFKEVNITGVRPPEPEPPGPPGPGPGGISEKSLNDIFLMISLVYHDATQNAQTQVMLRYRPDAGVAIPEYLARQVDAVDWGVSPLASAVAFPPRGRGRGTPAPFPPTTVWDQLVHHVSVGETLWAPYDHIVLVEVAEDARSAFFLRTDQGAQPEQVFKNEMNLDPDVSRQLIERLRSSPTGSDRRVPGVSPSRAWIPGQETRLIGEKTYGIGRADHDLIRQDPQKLLKQLTFRRYSSPGNRSRSGIEMLQVNREFGRRFGVRDGDVILEINEIPVRSKSQIIERIAVLYKRGVREFRVRILTMGRIEDRVYLAPDDR